jgi:hypothetical protein
MKVKRFNYVITIGLQIAVIYLLVSCSSGKYFGDFKSNKKSIDALAVIDPILEIISTDGHTELVEYELSVQVSKQISDKIDTMLSHKYFIKYFHRILIPYHQII